MVQKAKELFEYKELLFNLVRRELKVKYKGSALGFLWSFMNPLLLMVIYTVVFYFFLRISPPTGANGLRNFPAFLLCGLLAWNYLNNSLTSSVTSIVDSGNLIKKVYFPREIIPFASVFANLISFLLELTVLFGFLLILGNNFLLLLPMLLVVIAIETIFVLALSLLLSLSHTYFRDTKHLLAVIMTFWFFTCPIIYPFNMVEQAAVKISAPWLVEAYKLNPMASLILSYQRVMYFLELPSLKLLLYTLFVAVFLFLVSYGLFARYEFHFAEEV